MRRKKRRIRVRTIFVFALAALTGGLLLRTSQSVQIAEERLHQLQESVQQEKDSIRLLGAEWAYLNNPERLEKLNEEYLGLMPPQPAAIIAGADQIPAKTEEVLSAISETPQPVSLQSPPAKNSPAAVPAKTSDKDFTTLLKNVKKGGLR